MIAAVWEVYQNLNSDNKMIKTIVLYNSNRSFIITMTFCIWQQRENTAIWWALSPIWLTKLQLFKTDNINTRSLMIAYTHTIFTYHITNPVVYFLQIWTQESGEDILYWFGPKNQEKIFSTDLDPRIRRRYSILIWT